MRLVFRLRISFTAALDIRVERRINFAYLPLSVNLADTGEFREQCCAVLWRYYGFSSHSITSAMKQQCDVQAFLPSVPGTVDTT